MGLCYLLFSLRAQGRCSQQIGRVAQEVHGVHWWREPPVPPPVSLRPARPPLVVFVSPSSRLASSPSSNASSGTLPDSPLLSTDLALIAFALPFLLSGLALTAGLGFCFGGSVQGIVAYDDWHEVLWREKTNCDVSKYFLMPASEGGDGFSTPAPMRVVHSRDAYYTSKLVLMFSDHLGKDALRPFAKQLLGSEGVGQLEGQDGDDDFSVEYLLKYVTQGIVTSPIHDESVRESLQPFQACFNKTKVSRSSNGYVQHNQHSRG